MKGMQSEIFFARGLDDPNQLEGARKFRFLAQPDLNVRSTRRAA